MAIKSECLICREVSPISDNTISWEKRHAFEHPSSDSYVACATFFQRDSKTGEILNTVTVIKNPNDFFGDPDEYVCEEFLPKRN